MKSIRTITAGIVAFALCVGAAAQGMALRFAYSDSLMKSNELAAGKAACQPLRGDQAESLGSARLGNLELLQVRVTTGRCTGTEGWVGTQRVESVAREQSSRPEDMLAGAATLRFVDGDSLMKSTDVAAGMAACQPPTACAS